jgi:hypothetical protein
MTVNPNITILVDENNKVLKVATNIDTNVKVTVTRGRALFEDLERGKPFVFTPELVTVDNARFN